MTKWYSKNLCKATVIIYKKRLITKLRIFSCTEWMIVITLTHHYIETDSII